jgi:16S rRNA (cytidine1402-2'-O)-methyltransferase
MRLDKYTEASRVNSLLEVLESGKDIAYVSDAGTPGVSDPGAISVKFLVEHGIKVIPIPGASAVTSLISCAGLDLDSYMFCGFVPRKQGEFKQKLDSLYDISIPGVFFESPSRILKSFKYLNGCYPDINCVVAKELTKVHERFYRGPIKAVYKSLVEANLKGEWLFVLDFRHQFKDAPVLNEKFISLCTSMNLSTQDIVKLSVSAGMKKNQVYDFLHS